MLLAGKRAVILLLPTCDHFAAANWRQTSEGAKAVLIETIAWCHDLLFAPGTLPPLQPPDPD